MEVMVFTSDVPVVLLQSRSKPGEMLELRLLQQVGDGIQHPIQQLQVGFGD